uniref:Reverse transcriptase Ty1/copia-type domain-containing protein n=1 Tax=Solanum lycopersicum TaxID=4081 RepID=A0A3Q7EXG3_SOLLC
MAVEEESAVVETSSETALMSNRMSGYNNEYHNCGGSSSGSAYYPNNGSNGNSGYKSRNNGDVRQGGSAAAGGCQSPENGTCYNSSIDTNAKSFGTSSNNFSGGTQGMSLFTHEQYNQILKMLSKGKGKEVDSMANVATASSSGASNHMVHSLNLRKHCTDLEGRIDMKVNLPTGAQDLFSGRVLGIDDILITGSNLKLIQQVRKDLQYRFKMKDLGELKYFLGIEVSRNADGCKPASTPLEFNHKLTSTVFDKCTGMNAEDKVLDDYGKYQRLMDKLLKSVTGYIVKLGNALVSWKAKKQNTVSRSSAEAEFGSMATTVAEIIWLNELFEELGVELTMLINYDEIIARGPNISKHPLN